MLRDVTCPAAELPRCCTGPPVLPIHRGIGDSSPGNNDPADPPFDASEELTAALLATTDAN